MRASLIFSILLLAFSCGDDKPQDNPPLPTDGLELEGRWELVEARRNNRPTQTFDGLYFVFGPENQFVTNLGGDESTGKFAYDERAEIVTTEVALPATYLIREHNDGELMLETELEGFAFRFLLNRVVETKEEVES
ncbi:MAG: hypothetical protein AAFP08_10510 [Bacteroidota bacterium]